MRTIGWPCLLFTVAIVGFVGMPAISWPGDPTMWREETRSLLDRHSLAIDSLVVFDFHDGHEPGQYFVKNPRNGRWYSKYGIVNSLMSIPPMLTQRIFKGDPSYYRSPADVFIYNIWNLILSLLLAWTLLVLASQYTKRVWVQVVFVLCVFYCTYLWIYLRAQSSEIYQTLFYTAAFLFMVKFLRPLLPSPDRIEQSSAMRLRLLYLCWGFICLLVLTRILYILLLPLCVSLITIAILRLPTSERRTLSMRLAPHVALPVVAILAICGTINFIKFGSPLLSGYHQWMPESHLPTGPISQGLYGLLLRPRFSIFLYFPVLVFAAFGIWQFSRRHALEALAAWGGCCVFVLALAKIPTWAGEWTYGPRYILFALPVASLPLILVIDYLIDCARNARLLVVLSAIPTASVLLYASYLQFRVNQLNYFAYYQMRPPELSEVVTDYFESRPVGMIISDLQNHRDDLDSMRWFDELKRYGTRETIDMWRERVRSTLAFRNYYWWKQNRTRPEPASSI